MTNTNGLIAPTWPSLIDYGIPEWFLDGKFGIYAHWGLYSVPGFGQEWYGKYMYDPKNPIHTEHVKRFGSPADFGYKEFIPMFTADKYDPDEWADLFQRSGSRYGGFSLAHHDGFGLWDSDVYRWNVGKMGPKRDLYGEFVAALRRQNLRVVAPFHIIRGFNWFLPGWNQWEQKMDEDSVRQGREEGWDVFDPDYADFYWPQFSSTFEDFLAQWKAVVGEVIDKYQPDLMWFDGGKFREDAYEADALEMLAYYFNQSRTWGKQVCVLNKLPVSMVYNFDPNFGVWNFESGRDRPAMPERPWNDDMRIGDKSWGWVEGQTYVPGKELLHGLIDRVSRGGSLSLSLSPKADGTIPEAQQQSLLEVGEWLATNGEAIYNTRAWTVQAEGDTEKLIDRNREHPQWFYSSCNADDKRYTRSKDGNTLYAMTLGVPEGSVRFDSLGSHAGHLDRPVRSVEMLGRDGSCQWTQSPEGLTIRVRENEAPSDAAIAWKVEL